MIRNRLLVLVVLCAAFVSVPALADDVPGRETSFQAVSGASGESVPGGNLMVGAYALIWLILGLYVARMGTTQRGLELKLGALEARVEKLTPKGT